MGAVGFTQTSGTHLAIDGRPFYFAGANNYYLAYQSEFMVNSVLDRAQAIGLKVIRAWAFLDRGSLDGSVPDVDPPGDKQGVYFQYWDTARRAPAFNDGPSGLERLDRVTHKAGQRGLKLILPMVNNWKEFGGIDQYVAWFKLKSHADFYTDTDARDAYKQWASHLMNRRNTCSGILYKDDPAILAWELANEPRCRGSIDRLNAGACKAGVLTGWVEEMSGFLKREDPNHLVAVGDEGFFARGSGDWTSDGSQGVDFEAHLRMRSIDFGTVHLYPEAWKQNIDWGARWIEDHLAAGASANKPVVIEEFGWKERATRELAYGVWLSAIERCGGAADLFWMLSGVRDDGSFYPDYDGYTLYGPEDSPEITAHAAAMGAKNAAHLT